MFTGLNFQPINLFFINSLSAEASCKRFDRNFRSLRWSSYLLASRWSTSTTTMTVELTAIKPSYSSLFVQRVTRWSFRTNVPRAREEVGTWLTLLASNIMNFSVVNVVSWNLCDPIAANASKKFHIELCAKTCGKSIGVEQGQIIYEDERWHATDECFMFLARQLKRIETKRI